MKHKMSITKSPQSQRLKVFIDSTGMSITEFGKQCQIPSSSSLHQVVSKGKVPSTKVLNKIIFRFPQLNYDWVMLGYGEMLIGDKNEIKRNNSAYKRLEKLKKVKNTIKLEGAAKRLDEFIASTSMNYSEFSRQCGLKHPKNILAVCRQGQQPTGKLMDKILLRFPQLNYDWVMLGYGEMIDTDKKNKRQVISKEQLEQSESYQEMMDIIDQEVMDEQKPAFSIDVEVLWNRVDSLEKRMSEIEKRLSNINREFY